MNNLKNKGANRRTITTTAIIAAIASLAASAQVEFNDAATDAGLAADKYTSATAHGLGVNWIDFDADGWPDIFAVNGWNSTGAHLYRNQGDGTFAQVDILLPNLPNVEMMGSVFADYDNDGDSDIYIFTDNHNGYIGPAAGPVNILLQNQWVENGQSIIPGQPLFIDVAAQAQVEDLLPFPYPEGPAYRTASGGWLDYDRDGHIDLYLCHWDIGNYGGVTNRDRLLRNKGDGTFEDVTETTGIIPDVNYERSCQAFMAAHLDDDMWPDLLVGHTNAPQFWDDEVFFQNTGGTGFIDRTPDSPGVGDDTGAAMGITTGDIDRDGYWDVYITDLITNTLYRSAGADFTFEDNSAVAAGVKATDSWGTHFLDVDHDGWEDLFVATMRKKPNLLFTNNSGDGSFTEFPGGIGASKKARGSAYADFDRDGDLDIAVSNRFGKLALLRNDTISTGHWLQVELHSNEDRLGSRSNGDAIGAVVKVTANGESYMRQIIGGDSGHGQNTLGLHFGLGDATIAEEVRVLWPSGAVTLLTDQPIDTFLAVSEVGASIALTSPLPNTTIETESLTFSWTTNESPIVNAFQLTVGSTPGDTDIFDSGSLDAATRMVEVTGLPIDDSRIFARLHYQLDGLPYHVDYAYGAGAGGSPPPEPVAPEIVSQPENNILPGSTATFSWIPNEVTVDRWRIFVGSKAGKRDLYKKTLDASITSIEVTDLPTDGRTVYVQLGWVIDGQTTAIDYVYTAAGDGDVPPPPPPPTGTDPEMLSPVSGSELSAETATLTWTANGAAVDRWRLYVGTTPGGRDLVKEFLNPEVESYEVSGLPNTGAPIYVQLAWRIGSQITAVDYVYASNRTLSVARLWNEVLLSSIRKDLARPTVHARNLFHISAAMFDSWSVFEDVAGTYLAGNEVSGFSCPLTSLATPVDVLLAREEVISFAAYRLLNHRFAQSPGFSVMSEGAQALMAQLGYDSSNTSLDYSGGSSAALGNYIAECYIQFGLQDGANEQEDYGNHYYAPVNPAIYPFEPGNPNMVDLDRWQPISLPISIDQSGNIVNSEPEFLSPEWGHVVPFALTDADRTIHSREGSEYPVYMDPGAPPLHESSPEDYKWGFSLVSIWSAHLDPTDGVMVDISPASLGNITNYPSEFADYWQFYDYLEGGDASQGYAFNPVTGQPYQPQMVPRGDYARVLAEFWADGPDSETPPGHWFVILNTVSDHPHLEKRMGGFGDELNPLEWDVKSYFTLGGAMHDSAVAAWSIKGWHDYLRPVSAIRAMGDLGQSSNSEGDYYDPNGLPLVEGYIEVVQDGDALAGLDNEHVGKIKLYAWRGPDYIGNPETDEAGVGWILAENWWPYQRPSFVTPPFAGYVSGHSTFSRAAARVMSSLTGSDYFPGGMSSFEITANDFLVFEEGPSVNMTLQWATYQDASDQTSLSRIWGGIHPPADDLPGRVIGEEIGLRVFSLAEEYFQGLR